MRRFSLPVLPLLALAACVPSKPEPMLQPKPAPVAPTPVVVEPPKPVRPAGEWIDWPIEAGTWVYRSDARGSLALFGPSGANALVTLRCDKTRGRIFLSVAGAGHSGSFLIRTSSTMKAFEPMQASGEPPYVAADIDPRDPILDAIAFSRGRFAIEVGGLRPMAIPNWAEISRVVEDCRS